MDKIRVMLVDDHVMFRQGIQMLLETQTDIEVVGEAAAGDEVLEKDSGAGATWFGLSPMLRWFVI